MDGSDGRSARDGFVALQCEGMVAKPTNKLNSDRRTDLDKNLMKAGSAGASPSRDLHRFAAAFHLGY
jgi:hypothetical protein